MAVATRGESTRDARPNAPAGRADARGVPSRSRPAPAGSPAGSMERLEAAALRYLAHRERHEEQVKAYLARAGASLTQIRTVLSRFRRLGYLDDKAYARRWVAARLQRRPMGRARAEAELLAKGFGQALVRETLDDVYRDEDEGRLARALLRQRLARHADGRPRGQAALLRRHGFSEDTIEDVLGASWP